MKFAKIPLYQRFLQLCLSFANTIRSGAEQKSLALRIHFYKNEREAEIQNPINNM
jgi:hypothetical protein